ncbi:MAG: MBL fold metallo-hydrolase [Actinomycetota bacterium]
MELIVLGASAAYPYKGKACSGYLIKERKTNLLLDCGTGVLSNLFRWLNPMDLDAIVITHLHTDHFLDIYPLRYFLQYDSIPSLPLKVLAPPEASDFVCQLISKKGREQFLELFAFSSISEKIKFEIGHLKLYFYPVPHFVPTFGVRVEGKGRKLAYSSDCSYHPKVVNLARGADMFICEATLQQKDASLQIGHLTARQAGEIAQQAKAKRLLLTHIWPPYDPLISKTEAQEVFDGEVILAEENRRYEV